MLLTCKEWIIFSRLNTIKEFATSFLMVRSECPTKEGSWRGSRCKPKSLNFPLMLDDQKVEFPRPSPDDRPHIEKEVGNALKLSFGVAMQATREGGSGSSRYVILLY